ncbi:unnamed protein product [Fusarium fujikuroi]|nr:unnamed protein product [Fusarium fujikuroi]
MKLAWKGSKVQVWPSRRCYISCTSKCTEWPNNGQIEVLVDCESSSDIGNPANHHIHHHEELADRSEQEWAIPPVEPLRSRAGMTDVSGDLRTRYAPQKRPGNNF